MELSDCALLILPSVLGCRHIVHVPSGCVPIFLGNPRRGDRSVIDADGVW